MIRAFAVLSLSMFAACVSSSQAASPASPQPGVAVSQAPEDPYGAAGGPGEQFCAPNSTCSFECPSGGCAYACAPGSTCNIECDGGKCKLSCGPGATCNLECDGGSCAHACAPEASCNAECDGGDCL